MLHRTFHRTTYCHLLPHLHPDLQPNTFERLPKRCFSILFTSLPWSSRLHPCQLKPRRRWILPASAHSFPLAPQYTLRFLLLVQTCCAVLATMETSLPTALQASVVLAMLLPSAVPVFKAQRSPRLFLAHPRRLVPSQQPSIITQLLLQDL